MRPITTPDGKTRADLSEPDKRTFARAKDLALQFRLYECGSALGETAKAVVDGLAVILKVSEARNTEPDSNDPDFEVQDADDGETNGDD